MKEPLYLLPLFLGILACGIQPLPTLDVSNIVNATLTAVAQNNLQPIVSQSTFTPVSVQAQPTALQGVSSTLHYYWPATAPEEFALNTSISSAFESGFTLEFDNYSAGQGLRIWGGEDAKQYEYCAGNSAPHVIRGFDGCFPQSTGGGFAVEWKEAKFQYSVGGMGSSQDFVLQIAEQLISYEL